MDGHAPAPGDAVLNSPSRQASGVPAIRNLRYRASRGSSAGGGDAPVTIPAAAMPSGKGEAKPERAGRGAGGSGAGGGGLSSGARVAAIVGALALVAIGLALGLGLGLGLKARNEAQNAAAAAATPAAPSVTSLLTNATLTPGSLASNKAATSGATTDFVGSDPTGSDTKGSDPVGSDTKGSDTKGSDTVGNGGASTPNNMAACAAAVSSPAWSARCSKCVGLSSLAYAACVADLAYRAKTYNAGASPAGGRVWCSDLSDARMLESCYSCEATAPQGAVTMGACASCIWRLWGVAILVTPAVQAQVESCVACAGASVVMGVPVESRLSCADCATAKGDANVQDCQTCLKTQHDGQGAHWCGMCYSQGADAPANCRACIDSLANAEVMENCAALKASSAAGIKEAYVACLKASATASQAANCKQCIPSSGSLVPSSVNACLNNYASSLLPVR